MIIINGASCNITWASFQFFSKKSNQKIMNCNLFCSIGFLCLVFACNSNNSNQKIFSGNFFLFVLFVVYKYRWIFETVFHGYEEPAVMMLYIYAKLFAREILKPNTDIYSFAILEIFLSFELMLSSASKILVKII